MTRTEWKSVAVGAVGLIGSLVGTASGSQHGSTQVTLLARPVGPRAAGLGRVVTAWESTIKPNASTVRRCPTGDEFTYVVKGRLRFPPQVPRVQADRRGEATPAGLVLSADDTEKRGAVHAAPGTSWVGTNDGPGDATVLTIGICDRAALSAATDTILGYRDVGNLDAEKDLEVRVWEATIAKGETTGKHCHPGHETTYLIKGVMRYHAQYQADPSDRPVQTPADEAGAILTPGTIVHLGPKKIHEGNNLAGTEDAVVLMVSLYRKGDRLRVPPAKSSLANPTIAQDFTDNCVP